MNPYLPNDQQNIDDIALEEERYEDEAPELDPYDEENPFSE